jgi:DNA-binding winged helix-turn-helix (wHTH) protein
MAEAAAPRGAVHFGVFELNFVTGELRKAGIKIKLQDQPFLVLAMLLERPGELVTREELRSRLWPSGSFGDFDHGLNVAVKKLRRALSDSAENPRFIETLTRRGYRFVGQVEHVVTAGSRETVASPGNVTEEIEATGDAPSSRAETGSRSYPGTRRLIEYGVVAILLAAAGLHFGAGARERSTRVVTRFTISLPPSDQFSMGRGGLAISPDGSFLVYSATASKTGTRQLYLRPMDRNEATLIPGTEGAIGPFFSPDGEWVAFTAGGQLKKIPFRGGTPIALCARENMGAGSWSLDGTIFFAENLAPMVRTLVSSCASHRGGQPRDVTPARDHLQGSSPVAAGTACWGRNFICDWRYAGRAFRRCHDCRSTEDRRAKDLDSGRYFTLRFQRLLDLRTKRKAARGPI